MYLSSPYDCKLLEERIMAYIFISQPLGFRKGVQSLADKRPNIFFPVELNGDKKDSAPFFLF